MQGHAPQFDPDTTPPVLGERRLCKVEARRIDALFTDVDPGPDDRIDVHKSLAIDAMPGRKPEQPAKGAADPNPVFDKGGPFATKPRP